MLQPTSGRCSIGGDLMPDMGDQALDPGIQTHLPYSHALVNLFVTVIVAMHIWYCNK